jgi:hypothetical protein
MVPFEPVMRRRHILNRKGTKMKQRKFFSATSFAWLVWMAFLIPGAALAANAGARTEAVRFDASTHSLSVTIVNVSTKDISAYNISVDTTYPGGVQHHQERAVDLLPLMMSQQSDLTKTSPLRDGALHPGGSLQENIAVFTTSDTRPIAHIEAVVDAVIYTDRTSEATNDLALGRLIAARTDRLSGVAHAVAIVQMELQAPSNDPVASSIKEMRQIMADDVTKRSGGMASELLSIISDLENVPKVSAQLKLSPRDYLGRYLAEKAQQAMTLSVHTKIEKPR